MASSDIRVGPEGWDGAVANASGYQMVVAGPGTGKTEFLVRRVEHIVTTGLARRDEIAVVCFSRRAAHDLRGRVLDAVGGLGTPVDVTTFHSLALRLLEAAHPEQSRIVLTTPEQVGVVAKTLGETDPADWPVTYRGILTAGPFAAEVADFFMRCSERLLTPDDLEKKAADRADWRGLPGLYRRYLETLKATGRTDYALLLTSAVDLLQSDDGRRLAAGYQYVLVDEYQDSSPSQARLADLLAEPSGNLTVAGDPYQSIYSFRGAELRNMSAFETSHPDAERLVLTSSFRVPEEILTAALRVVSPGHLPGEAGPVEPAPHHGRLDAYLFDQETAEAEWIAGEVERSIQVEGIDPAAIAVLVRTKREMVTELSRALQRRGVPHDPPQTRLVDHPGIRLVHDLVTVAVADAARSRSPAYETAASDRAMRRVLLGPLVGLPLSKERQVFRSRKRTGAPWAEIVRAELPGSGLADLLGDPEWASTLPAADGFWRLWSTVAILDGLVDRADRRAWRTAWTAFSQVLNRQAERDSTVTLDRFFDLVTSGDYEATPLLPHTVIEAGVTLTTMHQAKGLEFDVVFIANAVEGVFPDLRRSRRMLRPELLSPERTTDPHAQHLFQLQEEMRLAYTAMTRARLRVVWTATDAGIDQGEHRPSRFLMAAAGADTLTDLGSPVEDSAPPVTLSGAEIGLRRTLTDPSAPDLSRLVAVTALAHPPGGRWDPATFAGASPRGPDSPILGETLHLSPSQAESYVACPRRYALERRLRLGDGSSPYAQFGSLVHEALERAEEGVLGTSEQHASVEAATRAIEEVWKGADFGTDELNQAWKNQAIECVANLYEKWPHDDGVPIELEKSVSSTIDGIEWVGKIDRLEQTPEGVRVVDYKTSRSPIEIAEGERSIQLAFYASAAGVDRSVVGAEMWYPRARTKGLTVRALDLDARGEILARMEQITRSITSEQWDPTPGSHCKNCSFKGSCPVWPEGKGAFLP